LLWAAAEERKRGRGEQSAEEELEPNGEREVYAAVSTILTKSF